MYLRQRGATFLGMVTIIAILGCGVYGGIRLTPIYMEYMAVSRALQQTAEEYDGGNPGLQQLRAALDRRWSVEDIMSLDYKDVEIKRTGKGYSLRAEYRAEAPFVGNVSLAVDFDKMVELSL
jgi:hypothetical protein